MPSKFLRTLKTLAFTENWIQVSYTNLHQLHQVNNFQVNNFNLIFLKSSGIDYFVRS